MRSVYYLNYGEIMNFQKDIQIPIQKISNNLISTDEIHFSEVSASLLENFDIACFDKIEIKDLMSSLEIETSSIKQYFKHNEFASYCYTLFDSDSFNIDLYIWDKKHTSIHSHNFVGAFKLVKGKIAHRKYFYKEKSRFSKNISQGELLLDSSTCLNTGDIHEITQGNSLIHRSVHLTCPVITLLIRCKRHLNVELSSYLPNGIELKNYKDDVFDENDLISLFLSQYLHRKPYTDSERASTLEKLKEKNSEIGNLIVEGIQQENNQLRRYNAVTASGLT
jgi:hypothetical protein